MLTKGSTAIDARLSAASSCATASALRGLSPCWPPAAASRFGASTNLSKPKYTSASSSTATIIRSMRCAGLRRDRLLRRHVGIALEPSGVSSKTQAKTSAGMKPSASSATMRAQHPGRRAEDRQQRAGDLHHQPRADQVQPGHADDVAALEFGDQAHAGRLSSTVPRSVTRQRAFVIRLEGQHFADADPVVDIDGLRL